MAGTGVDPISIGLSALQGVLGVADIFGGKSKVNDLTSQLTAYKKPEDINKLVALALQQASGDTQTQAFQTNQLDRAFSSQLGTAEKLGADPNSLSALFDQRINAIMKISEQTHASRTEAIGRLWNAYQIDAANDAAVQKSQNDIIKDKIAAAGGQVQAGYGNLSGGLNTALSAIQASKASNLYTTPKTT